MRRFWMSGADYCSLLAGHPKSQVHRFPQENMPGVLTRVLVMKHGLVMSG